MSGTPDVLTPRQRAVIERACLLDESMPGIAYGMGIAVGTVKHHLTGAYRKLGVASRASACYLLGRAHERAACARRDAERSAAAGFAARPESAARAEHV